MFLTDRKIDRQTNRQADRQTDRQAGRQANKQTDKPNMHVWRTYTQQIITQQAHQILSSLSESPAVRPDSVCRNPPDAFAVLRLTRELHITLNKTPISHNPHTLLPTTCSTLLPLTPKHCHHSQSLLYCLLHPRPSCIDLSFVFVPLYVVSCSDAVALVARR